MNPGQQIFLTDSMVPAAIGSAAAIAVGPALLAVQGKVPAIVAKCAKDEEDQEAKTIVPPFQVLMVNFLP